MSEPNNEPVEQPKAGELPPHEERCEYCGTADTDHKHRNGHRCCGDCCAAHGGMATNQYEYDFVEKIVAYKNEILAKLLAEQQVSAGLRERITISCGRQEAFKRRAQKAEASLAEANALKDELADLAWHVQICDGTMARDEFIELVRVKCGGTKALPNEEAKDDK